MIIEIVPRLNRLLLLSKSLTMLHVPVNVPKGTCKYIVPTIITNLLRISLCICSRPVYNNKSKTFDVP